MFRSINLAPLKTAFLSLVLAGKLGAFTLEEIDRFETRLPWNLEYSSGTCSLWISGNTQNVFRTTLSGRRVERLEFNTRSIAFTRLVDGRRIGVSPDGYIFGRGRSRIKYPRILDSRDPGGNFFLGGDILSDGTVLAVSKGRAEIQVYDESTRDFSFGNFPSVDSYRDVSVDEASGRTFAIQRIGSASKVVVFDRTFGLIGSFEPSGIDAPAEGIAIQPETGDIFVSFINSGSVNGQVIRFAVTGLDTAEQKKERPTLTCLSS